MASSPLERRADGTTVDELFGAGAIDGRARKAALGWLMDRQGWLDFAERFLLVVGALCLVLGILFFFAFNWASLKPWMRFALLQTAFLGAALGAWHRGLESPSGQALHLSAAVLVGVNLAIYGQVYQTGADAFELFVGWAALLVPWLVAAPHRGMRALWIALVELSFLLWCAQVAVPEDHLSHGGTLIAAAALASVFLLIEEWRFRREGLPWIRWCLVAMTMICISIPALKVLSHAGCEIRDPAEALALLALLAAGPAAHLYLARRLERLDLVSLTLVGFCLQLHVVAWMGRFVIELREALFGFGVMTLTVVGTTALLVHYLRRQQRFRAAGEEGRP